MSVSHNLHVDTKLVYIITCQVTRKIVSRQSRYERNIGRFYVHRNNKMHHASRSRTFNHASLPDERLLLMMESLFCGLPADSYVVATFRVVDQPCTTKIGTYVGGSKACMTARSIVEAQDSRMDQTPLALGPVVIMVVLRA